MAKQQGQDIEVEEKAISDYVRSKIDLATAYISKEIGIIESVENYTAASELLRQLPSRVKLVVHSESPIVEESRNDLDEETRRRFAKINRGYIDGVSEYLLARSRMYSPTDGSFWESLGTVLDRLGDDIRREGLEHNLKK